MTVVTSILPSAACNLASALVQVLQSRRGLEFAVLVGSRASGGARPDSDRDIALQWNPQLVGEDTLAWSRFLRRTWRELEDFYWDKHHAA